MGVGDQLNENKPFKSADGFVGGLTRRRLKKEVKVRKSFKVVQELISEMGRFGL